MVTVLGTFGSLDRCQSVGDGMADDSPVYQIFGVQDGKPRQAVEAGGRQIEVVSHTTGIRIGIVGIEHGILVSAVPLVGTPHFGYVVSLLGSQRHGYQQANS